MIRVTLPLLLATAPALAEVTAADATGAVVALPTPPARIVCLTTACIHVLAVFDVLPVAASTDNRNAALDPLLFGSEAEAIVELPWVDGYDAEQILSLGPDLVVGWDGMGEYMEVASLAAGAPLYLTTANQAGTPLDGHATELRSFGALLGRTEEAEAYVVRVMTRLEAYDAATVGATRLAILRAAPAANDFILAPACGPALDRVADCVDGGGDWQQMTTEGLLSLDPDVIVIEDWDEGVTLETLADLPLWPELSAVKAGRVHLLPPNRTLDYSLLAVDLSLDALVPLLEPGAVPAPLTDAEVAAALAQE